MHLLYVFCVVLTIIACVRSHDEDVHTVQYTTETFAEEVPKKDHFVMFYAPWCGHCKRLAPTWEQLAEMLNVAEDGTVKIAKVDCTKEHKICSNEEITGYPTLKFYKASDKSVVKFKGMRDLPSLTSFINEQQREGQVEDDSPVTVDGLTELNQDNLEYHVSKGKHFVKFYAPWCGHCQNLAPTWQDLAKNFEYDQTITIGKIDCTQSRDVCNLFEVKGYPTLLWIEDGKKVDKYQGDRSLEDLKSYVNKMMGSNEEVAAEETKTEPESSVIELSNDNFSSGIKNGVSMVKFFAPWCGHCKRLAPTWEDLGKKFQDRPDIQIVKVDCTIQSNKDLCHEQDVNGFPSVFLYVDGVKIAEYEGSRSLDDLYNYVLKHAPTHDEL